MCGHLLCPIDEDWNNEETRQKLKDGRIIVQPEDLPSFLWQGCSRDKEDIFDGFLKHELLIKTYLHIFRGPSHATGAGKSARKGNALIHGISKTSLESVAYCACILRHILSSQTTFTSGAGRNGDFQSKRFYQTLLDVMYSMEEDDQMELMRWWNDKIFAGLEEEAEDSSRTGKISVAAQMKARAREKRAAGQTGQ
ncbi:hypothetical protein M378DRAFT_17781 [Amanita muscaria Koide BX008]|uniref:Uncharacterized protein n=1 Tax=Amanita muscaria (strain Koide BX008) TaxID=946122 RepID=A0A0C2W3E6_AMAMK|nr:hypothetical protein M378DRAFT_17781 [Amanita muscaria Koide BX008]